MAGSALALLLLLAWAFAPRPQAVEVAPATRGPFETSIDEDARTRIRDRYVVHAPLAGRLQRLSLREGDEVRKGEVLATLMPVLAPMLDARSRDELRARLGASEASRQRALTRVEAARLAVQQARNELRRSEQLAQQGFIAPTKLDNDRLAVQAAQKELESAIESEHVASHEWQLARAALGGPRGDASAAPFEVRAALAGRVLKLHQASEATVPAGAALLELGDLSRLEIVAELLTADALQTPPGTPVRIDRWGGPRLLEGRVRRVEPSAFTKISALGVEEQRVNVLIDILSPAADWAALGDGYRVGVRLMTRQLPDVLTVPVSAVFPMPASAEAGPAGSAVFVLDAGHARLRRVGVGARQGSRAWITEGLEPGTQVIVYPPPGVRDGSRVSVRQP